MQRFNPGPEACRDVPGFAREETEISGAAIQGYGSGPSFSLIQLAPTLNHTTHNQSIRAGSALICPETVRKNWCVFRKLRVTAHLLQTEKP